MRVHVHGRARAGAGFFGSIPTPPLLITSREGCGAGRAVGFTVIPESEVAATARSEGED